MNQLTTKQAALWLSSAMVLLVLTPNTAAVFKDISTFDGWLVWGQAIAYSLFLEAGIIWFVLRARIVPVGVFMLISAVIHLAYYDLLEGWYITATIAISLPLMVFLIAEETRRGSKKRNAKVSNKKEKPVKKLNKHDRIMELIAQGRSDAQIAEMTGVNRSTVYRKRTAA